MSHMSELELAQIFSERFLYTYSVNDEQTTIKAFAGSLLVLKKIFYESLGRWSVAAKNLQDLDSYLW